MNKFLRRWGFLIAFALGCFSARQSLQIAMGTALMVSSLVGIVMKTHFEKLEARFPPPGNSN